MRTSLSTILAEAHGFTTRRRLMLSALTLAAMCWAIQNFTCAAPLDPTCTSLTENCRRITHPFMLSDNRHYVFYIWRRILNPHPLARFALAPLYLLSFRLIFDRLCLYLVASRCEQPAETNLTQVPPPRSRSSRRSSCSSPQHSRSSPHRSSNRGTTSPRSSFFDYTSDQAGQGKNGKRGSPSRPP